MGSDMDMLVKEKFRRCPVLLSADGDVSGNRRGSDLPTVLFEHSLNTFGILAKEGSNMTVIMDMAAERSVDLNGPEVPARWEKILPVSQSEHTGLSPCRQN